ncbi:MAG: aldo/keto reductase [Bacteroidota bacterium]
MQYMQVGNSDLVVSRISLGCMSMGLDHQENIRLIHHALAEGINLLDTADLYDKGINEESVGKAIQGRRDKVFIATKVGNQWRADGSGWDWNPTKAYIKQAVHQSLNRLQTDYIDLYQLHGGTLEDPTDETIEAFEELKQEGHIRYYGISSIRPNVIHRWLQESNLTSVMSQYSLLDRRPEEQTFDWIGEAGVGVLVRGAVAKGLLAGKPSREYMGYSHQQVAMVQKKLQAVGRSAAHLAIQYCLQNPAVSTLVMGASTTEQISENVKALDMAPLPDEVWKEISTILSPQTYETHRV